MYYLYIDKLLLIILYNKVCITLLFNNFNLVVLSKSEIFWKITKQRKRAIEHVQFQFPIGSL